MFMIAGDDSESCPCVCLRMQCQTMEGGDVTLDEGSKGINEQASYAANKLRQLYERLEYKRQALGSIQNAPRPDKKVWIIGQIYFYLSKGQMTCTLHMQITKLGSWPIVILLSANGI